MQPTDSTCEQKRWLIAEYERTAAEFSRSATLLQRDEGVLPREDYERLLAFTEAARDLSKQARLKLDRHVVEHGC